MKRKPRAQAKAISNGTKVITGGSMRKVMDPRSGQYAYPAVAQDGSKVYKTASGQMFKSTSFK